MSRIYNFSAGPAMLPESVLVRAQDALLNWKGSGVSIMEIGHRTAAFKDLLLQLEEKLRKFMTIPFNYKVLFLAGGGQGHFSFIPMNLTKYKHRADYLVSGVWSSRAADYAARYVHVDLVASITGNTLPDQCTWVFNPEAAYVYYCPNETINGVQINSIPAHGVVPLVADMTSSILSRAVDVTQFGLIFAAAQKNLGIAGITLLIIRDDLLENALDCVPEVFNYTLQAAEHSLVNTIRTVPVYMMDLMVDWMINEQGGLEAIAAANARKANLLYTCIDESHGFYRNTVDPMYRSQINVPFDLPQDELLQLFFVEAARQGLCYLNGHRLVGGARASLYNAMPEAGVAQLVA